MSTERGIIAWFTRNPVAANLLMFIIIVSGLIGWFNIKKKTFPEFTPNIINVSVPYLGAAPQEVEEGVVIKIEDSLDGLEGIKELTGLASEGYGRVTVEVETGYDLATMLDDVKLRIDAISSFPDDTEKPIISRQQIENPVIWVTLYGDADEKTLKIRAQQIRDEIAQLPEVSIANVMGGRDYEISISVTEYDLLKYGLTFDEIVQAIRQSSVDLPGGSIRTDGGNILLRTKGQAYTGQEFSDIPLLTSQDGTKLKLGEIAQVNDGFEEWDGIARFNNKPSISIMVKSVGEQNDIKIAHQVQDYVAQKVMPDGLGLSAWGNSAFYLEDRQAMMFKNLATGAALVFLLLTLFLRLKVAVWVIVGIPLCFLGTVWLMPLDFVGSLTINLLSLFGFILVLGILVDDAIVIGESIFTEIKEHGHTTENVIRGAQKVAMPATFGVLTTMAAFLPMLMVSGTSGKFWLTIGMVVILSLVFSLVESKLILPAHLAHMKLKDNPHPGFFARVQNFFADGMESFARNTYRRILETAMSWRYSTIALFVSGLLIIFALLIGQHVKFIFFPNVPSDFIQGNLLMEDGTPSSITNQALTRIENAIIEIGQEYDEAHPDQSNPVQYALVWTETENSGQLVIELTKPEERDVDAYQIIKDWRERVGDIVGAREFRLQGGTNAGGGSPIAFRLTGSNYKQLDQAATELERKLAEYDGVIDIENSYSSGNQEIKLNILPAGEALGLSQAILGQQVRQAFYGAEAQRIQRNKDEIKVMVRYPLSSRQSISDLENMRIRTPAGSAVPLSTVAELELGDSYSQIRRVDGQRAISVVADVDPSVTEPQTVFNDILENYIPKLKQKYPESTVKLEGSSKEQQELLLDLLRAGFLALLAIYALMAIPLRSYTQPFIIMSVIPFGIIGAVVGHILLGKAVSVLSIFGIIALGGVVVNDSLVMVDFINKERASGMALYEAARDAGIKRFRAIILTSLTTFFGLIPILLETSLQAQIVVPMALSLAFGIIFATVITLFMVPCLYLVGADIRNLLRKEKVPVAPAQINLAS